MQEAETVGYYKLVADVGDYLLHSGRRTLAPALLLLELSGSPSAMGALVGEKFLRACVVMSEKTPGNAPVFWSNGMTMMELLQHEQEQVSSAIPTAAAVTLSVQTYQDAVHCCLLAGGKWRSAFRLLEQLDAASASSVYPQQTIVGSSVNIDSEHPNPSDEQLQLQLQQCYEDTIRCCCMNTGPVPTRIATQLYKLMLEKSIPRSLEIYSTLLQTQGRERVALPVCEEVWEHMRTQDTGIYDLLTATVSSSNSSSRGSGSGVDDGKGDISDVSNGSNINPNVNTNVKNNSSVSDEAVVTLELEEQMQQLSEVQTHVDLVLAARMELMAAAGKRSEAQSLFKETEKRVAALLAGGSSNGGGNMGTGGGISNNSNTSSSSTGKSHSHANSSHSHSTAAVPLPLPVSHGVLLKILFDARHLRQAERLLLNMYRKGYPVSSRYVNDMIKSLCSGSGGDGSGGMIGGGGNDGVDASTTTSENRSVDAFEYLELLTPVRASVKPNESPSDLYKLKQRIRVELSTYVQLFEGLLLASPPQVEKAEEVLTRVKQVYPAALPLFERMTPTTMMGDEEDIDGKSKNIAHGHGHGRGHGQGHGRDRSGMISTSYPWFSKLITGVSNRYNQGATVSGEFDPVAGAALLTELLALNIRYAQHLTRADRTVLLKACLQCGEEGVATALDLHEKYLFDWQQQNKEESLVSAAAAAAAGSGSGSSPAPFSSSSSSSSSRYSSEITTSLLAELCALDQWTAVQDALTAYKYSDYYRHAAVTGATTGFRAHAVSTSSSDSSGSSGGSCGSGGQQIMTPEQMFAYGSGYIDERQYRDQYQQQQHHHQQQGYHRSSLISDDSTVPSVTQLYERCIRASLYTSGGSGMAVQLCNHQLEGYLAHLGNCHVDGYLAHLEDNQCLDAAANDLTLSSDDPEQQFAYAHALFPTFRAVRGVLRGLDSECDWEDLLSWFSALSASTSTSVARYGEDTPRGASSGGSSDSGSGGSSDSADTGVASQLDRSSAEVASGVITDTDTAAATTVSAAAVNAVVPLIYRHFTPPEIEYLYAYAIGVCGVVDDYPAAIEFLNEYLKYHDSVSPAVHASYRPPNNGTNSNVRGAKSSKIRGGGLGLGTSAGTGASGMELRYSNGYVVFTSLIKVLLKHADVSS